jgi:hypothetical protein
MITPIDLWERKTWPTRHLSGWSLPVDDGLYNLPYLSYLSYLSYFQVLIYNDDYSNRFAMVEDFANQTPVRMTFTSWWWTAGPPSPKSGPALQLVWHVFVKCTWTWWVLLDWHVLGVLLVLLVFGILIVFNVLDVLGVLLALKVLHD